MTHALWVAATGVLLVAAACSSSGDSSTEELQAIADEQSFAIIAVSDRDGGTVVTAGETSAGEPIEPDDAFFIGSTTKMVTSVAILQLVDEGLVALDAPAADYLDFPMDAAITVRHLLQHESGITAPDPWTCDAEATLDGLVAIAAAGPAVEPGEIVNYSTTGFMYLGQIIEGATGQDPGAVMAIKLFEPLGMDSTNFLESQSGPIPVAGTSAEDACPGTDTTTGTGGGLVSSAPDLEALLRAVHEDGLLTAASYAELTDFNTEVYGLSYSLGMAEMTAEDGRRLRGHWGTADVDGGAFYDADIGRTIVIAAPAGEFESIMRAADDWAQQQ
jgi:D-alanyl-D-alanine carboxypeptidase